MIPTERFEQIEVTSSAELRAWLERHHTQQESVWLVTFKKAVPEKYLSRGEVLDELLCFGWIDGMARKLDEARTMQLIGPRRVHHWAASYKQRAQRLTLEGRMRPAGLAAIAESKRRGLWDLLEEPDALTVPDDLKTALEASPAAHTFFRALPASSRRFALRWLALVKSPEARARRVAKLVGWSGQGKKVPGS